MRKIIIFIFLIIMLSARCLASDVTDECFDAVDTESVTDAVPDDAAGLLGSTKPETGLDFGESLRTVIARAADRFREYLADILSGGAKVLAVAVICAMASGVSEKAKRPVALAGAVAIAAVATGDMSTLLGAGKEAVEELDAFAKVLMPVLAAAGAAAGGAASSTAIYAAVMFACESLIALASELMMPIVFAHAAITVAAAACGNDGLYKLASLIKKAVSAVLKTVLALFTAYLAGSGLISGVTDALAVKTVKLTVGSIPVAGSVLSDAAETVVAGAKLVRGVIGIYGVLAIVAICLIPFVRILLQYAVFKISGALAAVTGEKDISDLISGLGDSYALLTGLAGTCVLLTLIGTFAAAAGVSV